MDLLQNPCHSVQMDRFWWTIKQQTNYKENSFSFQIPSQVQAPGCRVSKEFFPRQFHGGNVFQLGLCLARQRPAKSFENTQVDILKTPHMNYGKNLCFLFIKFPRTHDLAFGWRPPSAPLDNNGESRRRGTVRQRNYYEMQSIGYTMPRLRSRRRRRQCPRDKQRSRRVTLKARRRRWGRKSTRPRRMLILGWVPRRDGDDGGSTGTRHDDDGGWIFHGGGHKPTWCRANNSENIR